MLLQNGEILSLPADRIFGENSRHYDIDFMGHKAKFPVGPFAAAAQRCPVPGDKCNENRS